MRSKSVHSCCSKEVLTEKPFWVCLNFLVRGLSLLPRDPLSQLKAQAAFHPLGLLLALDISPLTGTLQFLPHVGSVLLWVLFTCKPRQTLLLINPE